MQATTTYTPPPGSIPAPVSLIRHNLAGSENGHRSQTVWKTTVEGSQEVARQEWVGWLLAARRNRSPQEFRDALDQGALEFFEEVRAEIRQLRVEGRGVDALAATFWLDQWLEEAIKKKARTADTPAGLLLERGYLLRQGLFISADVQDLEEFEETAWQIWEIQDAIVGQLQAIEDAKEVAEALAKLSRQVYFHVKRDYDEALEYSISKQAKRFDRYYSFAAWRLTGAEYAHLSTRFPKGDKRRTTFVRKARAEATEILQALKPESGEALSPHDRLYGLYAISRVLLPIDPQQALEYVEQAERVYEEKILPDGGSPWRETQLLVAKIGVLEALGYSNEQIVVELEQAARQIIFPRGEGYFAREAERGLAAMRQRYPPASIDTSSIIDDTSKLGGIAPGTAASGVMSQELGQTRSDQPNELLYLDLQKEQSVYSAILYLFAQLGELGSDLQVQLPMELTYALVAGEEVVADVEQVIAKLKAGYDGMPRRKPFRIPRLWNLLRERVKEGATVDELAEAFPEAGEKAKRVVHKTVYVLNAELEAIGSKYELTRDGRDDRYHFRHRLPILSN